MIKSYFHFIFREKGREGNIDVRNIHQLPLIRTPFRDQNGSPGLRPDHQESTRGLSLRVMTPNQPSHTSQGNTSDFNG